jgi:hypothetical protein
LAIVWISGFGFVGLLIEWRGMFSGNESPIHSRRTCGGIHVERLSKSTVAGEIGGHHDFATGDRIARALLMSGSRSIPE